MKKDKRRFNIQQVIAHWDSIAEIYNKENSHKFNPHQFRFIEGIKYINFSTSNDIKILSIWSRTGDAILHLRKKVPNAKIYNFEASTKMIEISKKRFPNESFMSTDLKHIDLEDNSVDYIISPETLEHTPEPDLLIKEFYRVLKPNGLLILSLPPRIADIHQWVWERTIGGHGDGPRKGISSKIVKQYLKEVNFKLKIHKAILLFPIGPVWFIELGNKILDTFSFIRELGIMQFYICEK